MGWKTGRGEYEFEQLYSACKNKSYSTVKARYLKFNPPGPGVRLGCGIRKLANEFEFFHEGGVLMSLARDVDVFDPDVQKQFATRLQVKFLGTALVAKEKYSPEYRFTREYEGNHLLALQALAPLPKAGDLSYEYLIAAGWSEGSVNRTPAEFKEYVRKAAREFNHPIACAGVREEYRDGRAPGLNGAAAGPSGAAGGSKVSAKVGVGEEIITPPIGVPMAGYMRTGVSTGVHDDLHVRSLVIEGADGTPVVMMTLSIINLDAKFTDRIRAKINAETGIPEENILISCTHTHSGPDVGRAGEDYIGFLIDQAAKSAVEAWKSRVPGRVGTGGVEVLELGRNDRRLEYGGLHPDPEVGLIKVEASSWESRSITAAIPRRSTFTTWSLLKTGRTTRFGISSRRSAKTSGRPTSSPPRAISRSGTRRSFPPWARPCPFAISGMPRSRENKWPGPSPPPFP
jgi:hypothetical protein